MADDKIALYEFVRLGEEVRLVEEQHCRCVALQGITPEILETTREQPPDSEDQSFEGIQKRASFLSVLLMTWCCHQC